MDDDLRRIDQVLKTLGPVRYELKFTGQPPLNDIALDQVLDLPNYGRGTIARLQASVHERYSALATVSFEESRYLDTVSYRIRDDTDAAYKVAALLDDWIRLVIPWYSRIATADFIMAMFALVFIGYLCLVSWAVVALVSHGLSEPLPEPSVRTAGTVLIQLAAGFAWVAPLILGPVFNVLRRPLFPIGQFAIGFGRRRHDRLRATHGALLVGVLLSAAVGIVVNLITR